MTDPQSQPKLPQSSATPFFIDTYAILGTFSKSSAVTSCRDRTATILCQQLAKLDLQKAFMEPAQSTEELFDVVNEPTK